MSIYRLVGSDGEVDVPEQRDPGEPRVWRDDRTRDDADPGPEGREAPEADDPPRTARTEEEPTPREPAIPREPTDAPSGEDLVEAARSLDPGADALPAGVDPLGAPVPVDASIHGDPTDRSRRGGAGEGRAHGLSARVEEAPDPGVTGESPSRHDQDALRPGGGPPVRRPARVIALANQKGGVGKTTSVINLGAALAELGNRVLLVDMDPQGSLGVGIGAEPHTLSQSVYNLLMNDGTSPDEVILQTRFENLHVLPSNIDLAAAEIMLVQEVAREQSLRRVLDRLRYRYDFILVDCPPSLGLLTINGLTAADGVIVPLECEYFALRGMTLLMNTIRKVQERLNPELEIKGILATMVDTRTIHAREVLERVHEAFGNVVFKSTINKTIRFAEAPVAGEPILTYAAENRGADAYRELAREVLSRESTS
ncbi:MAG: AAA family ATPase [Actinobacteria bacterium]|nr:AAA family ATPase [Actinomycetota bacterium]